MGSGKICILIATDQIKINKHLLNLLGVHGRVASHDGMHYRGKHAQERVITQADLDRGM